jgi:hypothetical protein
MAVAVNVDGSTLVKFGLTGDLKDLGYTRNGVDVTLEGYFVDIPGDQNGGDDGPPVDVQYLGEIARVRAELTKYDTAIALTIYERFPASAAGVPVNAAASSLLMANNQHRELQLNSTARTMTFGAAFPRSPVEINKGTKFSTLVCEFECHAHDLGVVYTIT